MTACLQMVLVTAGPGFIASRLIDRLLGDRYEGTAMYDITFLETTYETDTPACILIRRFGHPSSSALTTLPPGSPDENPWKTASEPPAGKVSCAELTKTTRFVEVYATNQAFADAEFGVGFVQTTLTLVMPHWKSTAVELGRIFLLMP